MAAKFWEITADSVDQCYLCILTILNFSYFPFWFCGLDLVSDGLCICFTSEKAEINHYF